MNPVAATVAAPDLTWTTYLISVIIFAILITYIVLSVRTGKTISSLQREIDRFCDEPHPQFGPGYLAIVYDAYAGNLKKGGVHKLNTQALVDSVKPAKWFKTNSMLIYFSAAVITLGLFGTFIGLFVSLGGITSGLNNLNGIATTGPLGTAAPGISPSDNLPNQIMVVLQEPLNGINMKFITSLAGLFAALVMGSISAFYLRPLSDRFDNYLISYLDNTVAPAYSTDTNATIGNALKSIEENLVVNIKDFSQNVLMLNETMTSSVGTLNNAVNALESSVNSMNYAIYNLKEPLEKFSDRIEAFGQISAKMDGQIKQIENVTELLADNVVKALANRLDVSVGNIDDSTRRMAEAVGESANKLAGMVDISIKQLENVMEGLKNDLKASVDTNNLLQGVIRNMQEANDRITLSIKPFTDACSALVVNVNRTTESVQELIRDSIKTIREEAALSAQKSFDEVSLRVPAIIGAKLEPIFTDLKASVDQLNDVSSSYEANLREVVQSFQDTNEENVKVLQDSYKDYKQCLESYDDQIQQLAMVVNSINDYVLTVSGNTQSEMLETILR